MRAKAPKTDAKARTGPSGQKHGKTKNEGERAFFLAPSDTPSPGYRTNPVEIGGYVDETGLVENSPALSAVPWLSQLEPVGGTFVWPRVMTSPHPRAVGSLGPDAITWIENRRAGDIYVPKSQKTLRPWQKLVILRALEIDESGRFVWQSVIVSTRRQSGKSTLLAELCLWRTFQGERFGEEQLVMHTGKDLAVVREVQRRARLWAEENGFIVRKSHGQEEIEVSDGSRWMVRGWQSVYGYSVSMGLVDEAWGVNPTTVDDGLEATMIERESAQLWLISTAHRNATELMLKRRKNAVRDLNDPKDSLIVEWSAPRVSDHHDESSWMAASPHWDEKARAFIGSKVGTDGFAEQWLNVWPNNQIEQSNFLIDGDEWRAKAVPGLTPPPGAPVVVAIEDNFGTGASAAMAWADGDRRNVTGQLFPRVVDAWKHADEITRDRPGSVVLCGITLRNDPNALSLSAPVIPVGMKETRVALPLLRELIGAGLLRHANSVQLDEQILDLPVRQAAAGGLSIHNPDHRRTDLVRCAGWAVQQIHKQYDDTPAIY